MAYYPRKPRVTALEVMKQIELRTGIPIEGVKKILDCYNEVVKESLMMNVEVPFGEIGYFSWKQFEAKKDISVWNAKELRYDEHQDREGFQKTVFRVNRKWGRELREASRFDYGESNPMQYEEGEE